MLLTRHVNCRVSDYLRQAYPNVSWEWMMPDPASFIVQGGTGRIRVYNVPDYEFADITLDQTGKLTCSMVKVVPVQGAASKRPSADPQVWYELEGRKVLEDFIMKESTEAMLNTADIPSVVKLASSNFGLTEAEGQGVFQHLIQDADYTLYGLANAVTRYSQDVEDYDRASKLEAIGYSVMTMSPALFRHINQVTSMAA